MPRLLAAEGIGNRRLRKAALICASLSCVALAPSCILGGDKSDMSRRSSEASQPQVAAETEAEAAEVSAQQVAAAPVVSEEFYKASLGCAVYGPPRWTAPRKQGPVDEAWPISKKDGYGWRVRRPTVVWREGRLELEVFYPKNSLHPGVPKYPLGGMTFADYFDVGRGQAGCLSYEVYFQPGFKFAKGGKLPGLWGGRGVAGCVKETQKGFSTRFMWSRTGEAYVYAYLADRTNRCGHDINAEKAGSTRVTPGRWHRLDQEVRLNTPGQRDGVLRVWFDRELVIDRSDIMYRATKNVKIDGLFFSSFFGGSSPGNISPRDQYTRFRNFEYREITD